MIFDSKEILEKFGENLRAERKKAGLSQEKLAARCGVDQKEISEIERGLYNPGVLVIVDLARGLEISPAVFFNDIK